MSFKWKRSQIFTLGSRAPREVSFKIVIKKIYSQKKRDLKKANWLTGTRKESAGCAKILLVLPIARDT